MAEMTTKEIILEVIRNLHAQKKIVTREALVAETGLKLTVIDDRVGMLIDSGQVLRASRGVYVPTPPSSPPRVIEITVQPNGMVVIIVGDQVLTLTRRESKLLGSTMMGFERSLMMPDLYLDDSD